MTPSPRAQPKKVSQTEANTPAPDDSTSSPSGWIILVVIGLIVGLVYAVSTDKKEPQSTKVEHEDSTRMEKSTFQSQPQQEESTLTLQSEPPPQADERDDSQSPDGLEALILQEVQRSLEKEN